ncbi:formylmethanofuran dehydrogenase subunit B [Candidatus Bathyarchaeota archaeon]|nr:formylmethanofuran dehydrogenase subunit B [Candidatus Bathyarchaeota archaeon]
MRRSNLEVVTGVTCPFCGCLCDDLEVVIEGGRITNVKNGCAYSLAKYLNYQRERLLKPMVREGEELVAVSLEEAVERAAQILVDSIYPVLYGWSSTSSEAQRLGIELAEEVRGAIDNTSSVCHGPTVEALQELGHPGCTLGQVRNRADLIIYWGSNPLQSHLRHMSRYTIGAVGRWRRGREDRTLIVVDVRKTYTARVADYFIQVEPNKDFELLTALRMALRYEEIEQERVAGVPVEHIEEVAEILRGCEFGALFYGLGLTMSSGKNRNIDAAISLVRDLNRWTKFVMIPMRGHFNVAGANIVFLWQTGYPFAVDFSHDYPRYNPGVTSVIDILSRRESDASLIVASDPVANFPRRAVESLLENPLIVIDPHRTATAERADVVIPSALVGIECEGTAYRMDGVPLKMKKVVDPPPGCLSDEEILHRILEEVRRLRGE